MNPVKAPLITLSRADFIDSLKDIYEHSEWVATSLFQQKEDWESHNAPLHEVVSRTMRRIVDKAGEEAQLTLLRAHPDLAGKAALAGELTHASTNEQAGAGLDQCSPEELATFTELNQAYQSKFGFPFIMAVKGATKEQILSGFQSRLPNDRATEFARALSEVHKIAGFRLAALPASFWLA